MIAKKVWSKVEARRAVGMRRHRHIRGRKGYCNELELCMYISVNSVDLKHVVGNSTVVDIICFIWSLICHETSDSPPFLLKKTEEK